jgi:asparagine synthetase B (glutamine-hydrolysing)
MIVRLDKEQPDINRTDDSVEDERYQLWWDGLIFVKGTPSGAPSVQHFLHELRSKELPYACGSLSGTFACLVFDKLSGNYYAFADNRSNTNLFYSEKMINTSFLDMLPYVHPRLSQLKMPTIVEFILTGRVFFPNVFFDSIRSLQHNEIVVIKAGKQQVIEKHLPDLLSEKLHQRSFVQAFEDIVKSVKNRQLSIDLSGGTDSRLTVLLFREFGASFETAVSGMSNHPDVIISSQLAARLGLNHYVTLHTIDESSLWQDLRETFYFNSFGDVMETNRLYQLQRDRARRGCSLAIGSSGGELYKDGGWWRTALLTRPGLNQPEAVLKRLVDSGLVGWGLEKTLPKGVLSKQLEGLASEYKPGLLEQLRQRFRAPDKYKLADLLFYEYSINSLRSGRRKIIDFYDPILDRELVSIGIHLPFQKRLFHSFHRELITRLCPEAAKFNTTRGNMSCASGLPSLLKDLGRVFCHSVRARIKQGAGVTKYNPELYSLVRRAKRTKDLFDNLKQQKIVAEEIKPENISNKYLGRLITVAMLLEEIDKS